MAIYVNAICAGVLSLSVRAAWPVENKSSTYLERRQSLVTLLVSGQHLVEKLVGHATSNKLLLGQNTILVFVHLTEDLLRTPFGRVSGIVVGQLWTNHVVDRL